MQNLCNIYEILMSSMQILITLNVFKVLTAQTLIVFRRFFQGILTQP